MDSYARGAGSEGASSRPGSGLGARESMGAWSNQTSAAPLWQAERCNTE